MNPEGEMEVLPTPDWSTGLPRGVDGNWPVVPAEEVHGRERGFAARVLAWLALGSLGALARLPRGAAGAIGALLSRVAAVLDRRHSDAARAFLKEAFPEVSEAERERLVRCSYRHFFEVVLTSARLARRPPGARLLDRIQVVGGPEARRFVNHRGGRIVVTAHLGDWEVGSAALPWMGLDPVYVVGKPPKNHYVSRAMLAVREARGIRVLPRRGAMAEAPAVIAAGGTLALLLDQRARTKPVMAPFFGRLARCDRSAGVLLKRLRAPVLLAFCLRIPGAEDRYRLECVRVLWPEDVSGWTPKEWAEELNLEFERRIRAFPEQYFWLHDRYKDTPRTLSAEDAKDPAPLP